VASVVWVVAVVQLGAGGGLGATTTTTTKSATTTTIVPYYHKEEKAEPIHTNKWLTKSTTITRTTLLSHRMSTM